MPQIENKSVRSLTKKERIKIMNDAHLEFIDEYLNSIEAKKMHPTINQAIKNRKCKQTNYVLHTMQLSRDDKFFCFTSVYLEEFKILDFEFVADSNTVEREDGDYVFSSSIKILDPIENPIN